MVILREDLPLLRFLTICCNSMVTLLNLLTLVKCNQLKAVSLNLAETRLQKKTLETLTTVVNCLVHQLALAD